MPRPLDIVEVERPQRDGYDIGAYEAMPRVRIEVRPDTFAVEFGDSVTDVR